ncbi:ATP-binding protein [Paraburkholderia rhizosphaerae]|uniref:histidine kinase n=1 Tax=Paraburkholderia rhizosphaerae TaxID=480658 RepID=A0A4R8LWG9_9BURK|nr:ATP-binding protein [Paraburkholderia rhizosphaerae]TDY52264.1 two-component system OmpR family sensor kinase [Paraburkholderia rhizosphaerae]
MRSIRSRLLGWLIFGFGAASAAASYGIFHTAREEAGELFDYELRTVALSLPSNLQATMTPQQSDAMMGDIADDRIAIDIWDTSGKLVYHSQHAQTLDRHPPGMRTIEEDEVYWRVFGVQQPTRFVQVAQPLSVRNDLALTLALHTLWPIAVMVPVAIMIVLFVVTRGLGPIGGLSRSLGSRSLDALEPLPIDVRTPVEVQPLVVALNDLLKRLQVASQAQRMFVSDAAHELRSPLAALQLQLQAAASDGTLTGSDATLERIQGRLKRLIHLVQQLLTLAREDAASSTPIAPVSVRRVGEQTVGEFSLLAEAKHIDLGLETAAARGDADLYVAQTDQHALFLLLSTLIDNAIRYTPEGGTVDVLLERAGGRIHIEVRDTGPGIPDDELERVFDRFYRGAGTQVQGSGLGLAIAARIAKRLGVALSLRNRTDGCGLSARIDGFKPADEQRTAAS